MDLMLFIDTDSDIRLARRMRRDIAERGRDIDGVLKQYTKFVKPSFDDYIQPSKKHADVIIPRGAENTVALDIIITHIKKELEEHDIKFRNHVVNFEVDNEQLINSVLPKPVTNEIIENSIEKLNNENLKEDKAVLQSVFNDLTEQLAKQSVQVLPEDLLQLCNNDPDECLNKISVIGISGLGKKMKPIIDQKLAPALANSNIEPVEDILIQTEKSTNEPQLFACELDSNIKDKHVFLVDSVISTGSVAIMAIKVLLDNSVKEENITFLSLLSSPKGLYMITKTFPNVKIITLNINPYYENNANPFNPID